MERVCTSIADVGVVGEGSWNWMGAWRNSSWIVGFGFVKGEEMASRRARAWALGREILVRWMSVSRSERLTEGNSLLRLYAST